MNENLSLHHHSKRTPLKFNILFLYWITESIDPLWKYNWARLLWFVDAVNQLW